MQSECSSQGTPPLVPYESMFAGALHASGFPPHPDLQSFLLAFRSDAHLRMGEVSLFQLLVLRALTDRPLRPCFISIWGVARGGQPIRTSLHRSLKLPRQPGIPAVARTKCILFVARAEDDETARNLESVVRRERGSANKVVLAAKYACQNGLWYRVSRRIYEPRSPFSSPECVDGLRRQTPFERDVGQLQSGVLRVYQHVVES